MPNKLGIGARLKEERRRVRRTQQEVADFAAVDRNTQINYEAGHTAPPADYLQRIEQLGLDPCYIITGRRPPLD